MEVGETFTHNGILYTVTVVLPGDKVRAIGKDALRKPVRIEIAVGDITP